MKPSGDAITWLFQTEMRFGLPALRLSYLPTKWEIGFLHSIPSGFIPMFTQVAKLRVS